jgi:hypothetical protein
LAIADAYFKIVCVAPLSGQVIDNLSPVHGFARATVSTSGWTLSLVARMGMYELAKNMCFLPVAD